MSRIPKSKNKVRNTFVLKGCNIIDCISNELQKDMIIVTKDGVITDIGKANELAIPTTDSIILDLSGKTVLPGFIDSHIHLTQSGVDDFMLPFAERMMTKLKRNAELTLKSGITTVRNMPGGSIACLNRFRNKVNQGKLKGPRILTCGSALSPPHGYFSLKMFFPFPPFITFLLSHLFGANGLSIDVNTIEEGKEAVRVLKNNGVDFIKTVSPGAFMPFIERDTDHKEEILRMGVKEEIIEASMKEEVLTAIAKEAHALGLKVSVHNVCWPEGFKQAVFAGADSIEHTPLGLIDEETFDRMKEKQIFWVPTAYTFYNWAHYIDDPEAYDREDVKGAMPKTFHSFGKKTLAKVREGIKDGTNPYWKKFYEEISRYKEEYFPINFKQALNKQIKIVAGGMQEPLVQVMFPTANFIKSWSYL